jgi:choline dehydrogenase
MTFDYIIIGAGSAGCVLANRLSEDPSVSVLLIEAGGRGSKFEIQVPAAYGQLNYTNVDWGYYTEPQAHVDNRRMYQPRGKALGGCSSTNAMAYVRGHRRDYDMWAEMGATGWDYDAVLPFFKKSEHNEQLNDAFHGQSGELNVTFPYYQTPIAHAFLDACAEQGIPKNPDYNGAEQEGATMFQFTIKNGKRHSTAAAFLKPILDRKNLTVFTKSIVKQLVMAGKTVASVEILRGGKTEKIQCRKEVLLSAGAFGSPQILMLSGIGDSAELSKHGIKTQHELAGVGKNLHDHVMFGISCLSTYNVTMNDVLKPLNQVKFLMQWLFKKSGPLTISPLEANAFVKSDPSVAQPDLQLFFVPGHMGNETDRAKGTDIYKPNTYPKTSGFTILPVLLQAKSRGYIGLRSANPLDAPIIQQNYLEHPDDLALLTKGYHIAKNIMESKAFDAYRIKLSYPSTELNEAGIHAHIRESLECVYHPVSTCRMGNDDLAVVDSHLRVRGLDNLRVIDGSVMPRIVSGNTNAACILIGEKGADLVKKG